MRILWICPVIPGGPGVTGPRIIRLLDTLGAHASSWDTTESTRANPYAVGCSEVTDGQLALLQSDVDVIVFNASAWDQIVQEQLATERLKIRRFCDMVGVAAPEGNEVIRDLCSRMTVLLNVRRIEAHIQRVDEKLAQKA